MKIEVDPYRDAALTQLTRSKIKRGLDIINCPVPEGYKVFDVETHNNGSCLVFLETPYGRASIVIAEGDDHVDRFLKLLEEFAMAKEIGMSPKASAKAKAYDEKMDKAKGLKEGSKADIKADKAAMKKFPAKKGKK